jgi:hypothetical protein
MLRPEAEYYLADIQFAFNGLRVSNEAGLTNQKSSRMAKTEGSTIRISSVEV